MYKLKLSVNVLSNPNDPRLTFEDLEERNKQLPVDLECPVQTAVKTVSLSKTKNTYKT